MAKLKFDELTKPEQRVVIAKDLIARLNAKEFVAQRKVYFQVKLKRADDLLYEVEKAFEGWGRYGEWSERSSDARMRAIAENIIRNKGRFVGVQLLNSARG